MKLYDLKKVLFITLLAFTTSVQLQAMSLRELILIMFVCSPGTQTVAQQYIKRIGYNWDRLARSPDDNILLRGAPLKSCDGPLSQKL